MESMEFWGFLLIVISIAIYFLPTLIAVSRNNRNKLAIFMLNLFLGWTFIGWIVAIVWAFSANNDVSGSPSLNNQSTINIGTAQPLVQQLGKNAERTCPFCAEQIKLAAIRCRHCGSDVPKLSKEEMDGYVLASEHAEKIGVGAELVEDIHEDATLKFVGSVWVYLPFAVLAFFVAIAILMKY